MSHDSFRNPTVPWYAKSGTKPIRPKPPRPIPANLLENKIAKSRWLRAVYKWIRTNWSNGDCFYISPDAANSPTYSVANRFGIFRDVRAQGYLSRVFVDWLDEGHKINMEVVTFYRHATKLDLDGNVVDLPEVNLE